MKEYINCKKCNRTIAIVENKNPGTQVYRLTPAYCDNCFNRQMERTLELADALNVRE